MAGSAKPGAASLHSLPHPDPGAPAFGAADLAACAELLGEGLLVVEGGVVRFASPRAARLCGCSDAGELIGRDPLSVLDTTDAVLTRAGAGAPVRLRVHGATPAREVEVRDCELGGGRRALLLRGVDAKAHAGDEGLEPGRAEAEAEALRAALDDERQERSELVALVAHELRTPITVIRGYARLLLGEGAGELDEQQRGYLVETQKSCDRLDAFVGRLIDATRAQHGAGRVEMHEASLAPLLAEVAELLMPLTEEAGVTIDFALDVDALWARFDAERIEQVVTNLVVNAIKYAGRGAIELSTAPRREDGRDFVEVSVRDEGPGVDAAERLRIFEPYVRGDASGGAAGLGLGLALCRRIVEAHDGAIGVDCPAAGGSRFWFTLPAAGPKRGELAEASATSAGGGD